MFDYAPFPLVIETSIDNGGRTGVRTTGGTIDKAFASGEREGSFHDDTLA